MEEKETSNLTGVKKIKKNLKEFHTKKPYIEFFTALLTVPVLLTVIFLNVNNIRGSNTKPTEAKPDENQTIVITQPENKNTTEKEVIVTKQACEPGIGDISIVSPEEGENLTDNPIFVDVDYNANGKCNIVWSYRINNGGWSNFDDRSIALYNLESGDVKMELRIKSVVNSDTDTLTRRFIYSGDASTTPVNIPSTTPLPTQ